MSGCVEPRAEHAMPLTSIRPAPMGAPLAFARAFLSDERKVRTSDVILCVVYRDAALSKIVIGEDRVGQRARRQPSLRQGSMAVGRAKCGKVQRLQERKVQYVGRAFIAALRTGGVLHSAS